jgi:hypothetical protein
MLTSVRDVTGRVLRHDKQAGYVFTESDFFPPGTRPGLTAGIPPGKRALRVEAEKIPGLVGLQVGDRFDLVATVPVEVDDRDLDALGTGPYAEQLALEARFRNLASQAQVRVIVQAGVIVSPVETREIPISSASLTRGVTTSTRPVQEVVIAIDPSEVAPLNQALGLDAEIVCTPRSGHPEDPQDSITPGLEPTSPFSPGGGSDGGSALEMVEVIRGGEREVLVVPGSTHTDEPENGGGSR